MLRERAFALGGVVTILLGVALVSGLLWAGAGVEYYAAYLAGAFAWVLGGFFLLVAREARRYRRSYLRAAESGEPIPPDAPPPR